MPVYIALLRGINVGGNKRIKMADLRDLLASIGLPEVKTLLASGNVIFESDDSEPEKLASKIEEAIQAEYDFDVKVIIRRGEAIDRVIENNPLVNEDFAGNQLLVTFLEESPAPDKINDFQQSHTTNEVVYFVDREIFIHYVDGAGQSKLSNVVIEGKLETVGTARNWNTVLKIAKSS